MTIRRQKIQIDVEATTEGAVRGMDRVAAATDKARKAVEKDDAALRKASLEYQVAQARATNLAEAKAKAEARVRSFTTALDRNHAALRKVGVQAPLTASGILSMAGNAANAARGVMDLGRGALSAIEGVADLANESLRLSNVFDNLPYSLNAARTASRGLADDVTLARNAIMANQSGVATTAEAYAELVGMAQTLALKMGRDVSETVERVTMGIAKQEREILDELVILPRMEDMWKTYAETLGKASKDLTDHERNTAFTTSAIEAMRKATVGVEVDMSGAAASIARATVEVKNLRAAALGGVEAHRSLAQGVRELDAQLLRQVKQMRTSGVSFYEVEDALKNAGVATEAYRNNAVGLERDIMRALKAEAKHYVQLAEKKELTEAQIEDVERLMDVTGLLVDVDRKMLEKDIARLNVVQQRAEAEATAAAEEVTRRQERILEIEEQLAFGRAAKISQEQINVLVAEEAELRALVLESEGKQAEAAEIRRKAQLEALKAMGESTRPKSGGRRRDSGRGDELRRVADTAALAQWDRMNGLVVAKNAARYEQEQQRNPFTTENLERQLGNVIDFEERRASVVLSARMREIDSLRAAGVDPVLLAEQESQARLASLEVQQGAIERRYEREILLAEQLGELQTAAELRAEREVSLLEHQDQVQEQHHAAEMARIAARRAAEETAHKRRAAIVSQSSELVLGAAMTVVQASIIEGKSLKATIAHTAKAEAMRHALILGPSELIRAAISFASYNYAAGAAHLSNAAQSFAFAGAMGAIAGATGGFGGGGRGKPVAGFGAADFGGGSRGSAGAGGGAGGGSSGGSSSDMGGEVPISPETQQRVSGSAAQANVGRAPVVVHMGGVHVTTLGEPNDETISVLEQATRKAGQRTGRMVAGGRG